MSAGRRSRGVAASITFSDGTKLYAGDLVDVRTGTGWREAELVGLDEYGNAVVLIRDERPWRRRFVSFPNDVRPAAQPTLFDQGGVS